jgi:hypothetical protein
MARDITVTFDDGSSHVYKGAPDDITPTAVQARAEQDFGKTVTALDGGKKSAAATAASAVAPAKKGERTIGEAFTDTGAGVISGLGQLAQFPGLLYGLARCAIQDKDFATTGLQGVGKEMQDYAKTLKSAELKRREAETQKKVREAEQTGGQWAAFKTQLYESGTDPMQLGAFLAEQAPASIPSIIAAFIPGVGPAAAAEVKALQVAAQAATTVAAKQAAEQALGVALKKATESAVKRGTTASVGTGAVQQGTSVGVDAYKQVYDALIAKGVPPEQAAAETINKARTAGAAGAVISLLTQRLPGAQAMERALAGEKGRLGRVAGAVVGGVKATPSEVLEEVGGKATQNVAAMTVNPEQSLTEGLGQPPHKRASVVLVWVVLLVRCKDAKPLKLLLFPPLHLHPKLRTLTLNRLCFRRPPHRHLLLRHNRLGKNALPNAHKS